MSTPRSISVTEVAALLQTRETGSTPLQLIDVREDSELSLANLNHWGFRHYPLSRFADWEPRVLQELRSDLPVYVICHHGMRSLQMGQWLCQQGFGQVYNISGGIDAWSADVDPSIPTY